MYICLCILIVRNCPFLYNYFLNLFGSNKAHSLYRCVGSWMSLLFNHSINSLYTSGLSTLLVISVNFSTCSGKIKLENIRWIASWTFILIVSTFKSLLAQNLERGHRWWSLYIISLLLLINWQSTDIKA